MRGRGWLIAIALIAAGGETAAADVRPITGADWTLRIAAGRTSCPEVLTNGRGLARARWTAPVDAAVNVRLAGGSAADWDLALFDGRGRRLEGAAGFGADEVVAAQVGAGEALVVQACRRRGGLASAPLALSAVALPRGLRSPRAATGLVRVRARTRADVARLQRLGLDLGEHSWRDGVDVVLRGAADLRALRATGLPFRIRATDLAAFERAHRRADRAYGERQGSGGSQLPSGRTAYRDLEDHYADLKRLAEQNPAFVRPVTLAAPTFQGRPVEGVVVGSGNVDDGRPTFLLVGVHHAREWPAGEMVTEWLIDVLARQRERRVRNLLRKLRIVAVPIQNPDGFVTTRTQAQPAGLLLTAQSATARLNYHRGTCSGPLPAAAPCDLNPGADPNRNYGAHWGSIGSSAIPYLADYRGAAPWSESETENVHRLAQELNVTMAVSMHNVAGLVLRPPGVLADGPPPDEDAMAALGAAMGRATAYRSTSFADGLGYDGSGITEDWVYGAQGAFTYTIEVGGTDFHGPFESHVVRQWLGGTQPRAGKGVREALTLAAEGALDRAKHAIVSGRSRRGALLRLRKLFTTVTPPVCTLSEGLTGVVPCVAPTAPRVLDDRVEYTMTVPRSGRFAWHVSPSTRPFEQRAGATEAYTLTCERAGTVRSQRELVVQRGQTLRLGRLAC